MVTTPANGRFAARLPRPFDFAHREMSQLFDALASSVQTAGEGRAWFSPASLWEAGDCFYVEADMPERGYGRVERSITLPETIDPDSIEAQLKEGVLLVSLRKRPETLPKRIEIKS